MSKRSSRPCLDRALAVVAAIVVIGHPVTSVASSHREAPSIALDPAADNTDVYAFTSPDKPDTVTMIANWYPFQEPQGGPNFYPWRTDTHYDVNVDNDGDGKPDLVFRWTFHTDDRRARTTFLYNNGPVTSLDDENLLYRQTYKLELIDSVRHITSTLVESGKVAPSLTGTASMPDFGALRSQAITNLASGAAVYVGPSEDSFFLDLRAFDLLYGGNLSEVGQNTLAGYNVNTIAIQVPKSMLALNHDATRNPVVGIWSDAERPSTARVPGRSIAVGPYIQVSRLGNPLFNELIMPAGLKDSFNAMTPNQDRLLPDLLSRINSPEVPRLIQAIYGVPAPAEPRADLVEILLTGITTKAGGPIKADLNSQLNNADVVARKFVPSEELRLNMAVPVSANPNRLGVLAGDLQGFPNGRRLSDDVVDILLQSLEGAARTGVLVPALAAGDAVNANHKAFGATFPYVPLPNGMAVNHGSP